MREGIIEKPVCALQRGDILFPTGNVIVSVSAGLMTPKGKMDVVYKNKRGQTRLATWGRHTKIGVVDG